MNGLINLETKILALYRRLCVLEIKGQKNTKKYYNILSDLKKKLNDEKKLLTALDFRNISDEKIIVSLETAKQIDESIEARMMTIFADFIIKDISENSGVNEININDKIVQEAHTNIFMFSAKFLYELIQKEQNEILRNQMTLNFYELCYLQPRLGCILLADSFEVRDEYFKSCYFIADLLNVDRKKVQELIDEECAKMLFNELGSLFYDEKCSNPNYLELNRNLTLCNFKAMQVVFSEEGYIKAKNSYLHSLEEYDLTHHINYEFVTNLFCNENKQKDKVATITFGKPLI